MDINKKNNFINNINYFKLLKIFNLFVSDKVNFTKNDLINIINNLSKQYLIEKIKIEIQQKLLLEESDNNLLFINFPKIKFEETKNSIKISLNSDNSDSSDDEKEYDILSKFSDYKIKYDE